MVKIYQSGLADTECAGFLDEVLEDLHSKQNTADIRKLPSIEEVYKHFSDWERSIERKSKAILKNEKNRIDYPSLPVIYKNTGRNEKCPCGSGQKFKKCHGKNFI
ncbi:MAG: SEC-C domain-containing protein [Ignavibacteria bacterium]|nr:SEC-C domain-containing protein [Ignavibacteria bacterium]